MASEFTPIEIKNFSGAFTNVGDPRSLRPDEAQDFKNLVLFGNGSFGSRAGAKRIAEQIDTTEITALMALVKKSSPVYLIAGYDDKIVKWDESGNVWSSAIHTSTTSGESRDGVSYDDYIWMVNKGTGLLDDFARYDGTTYTEYPANPKGNKITLNKQRAIVSGVDSALQNVYYSAIDDLTDFTYSTPRAAGEGGIVSFPEFGDAVTSLVTRDFGADLKSPTYIFKGSSIWTLSWETITLTSGVVEDYPVRSLLKSNTGCSFARAAYFDSNNIFYADEKHKDMRTLGYQASLTDQRTNSITNRIKNTMKYLNFDEAAIIEYDNKILMACKTSEATFNDVVVCADSLYPSEDRPAALSVFDWHVNCWEIYKNDLYFGSSDSGDVYKAFEENDDEGAAISCLYSSGNMGFGIPSIAKRCESVFIEGYMTDVAEITIKAFHDFNISETWSVTINGQSDVVSQNISVALGTSSLGSETPLGGGSGGNPDTDYKPFYASIKTPRTKWFRQKLTIESDTAGGAWIVNNITYNVSSEDPKWMPTSHQIPT